jgi:CRISPR-associated protein (TIGR03984 family)
LSSTPFPDLSPKISKSNLLEIRLFGKKKEILIWRTEREMAGRSLTDEPIENKGSPFRRDIEKRILVGDWLIEGPKDGFTRVGTADGREQGVPLECTHEDFKDKRWPLRLEVRHYFEQEQETGAIRVAVSRLVDVFKEVR